MPPWPRPYRHPTLAFDALLVVLGTVAAWALLIAGCSW